MPQYSSNHTPIIEDIHLQRARDILSDSTDGHIWIFGFGSLVASAGFEYDQRVTGYIKGWKRVWYQGSTDHRGTTEHPGRTVTLIPFDQNEGTNNNSHTHLGIVWGAAYRLKGTLEQQHQTLSYLEWREKQYDLRARVDVYNQQGDVIIRSALCYIATSHSASNPNFLGPASLADIAQQIARSHGPSGPNSEYVFNLCKAVREMGPRAIESDPDLFWLENRLHDLLNLLDSSTT